MMKKEMLELNDIRMSNKEQLNNPVKMYWQDFPENEEIVKNVLPAGVYCEPGTMINLTHVHAEAKPWLQKTKNKKKDNKMPVIPPVKQVLSQSKPYNINQKKNEGTVNDNENSTKANKKSKHDDKNKCVAVEKGNVQIDNNLGKKQCSLAELRKEDKQRVADLVREMAKFSEEKEKAVQELTNLKTNFTTKLKSLEVEKQKMIKEQDSLKEKVLRYELILKEIKEKQRTGDGNGKCVESILNNHASLQELTSYLQGFENVDAVETTPETFPGNLRKDKQNSATKNVVNVKNQNIDFDGVNELADLFFKQQDKFQQQQEILQKQIEQLQKLQESISDQQQQQLKESLLDSKPCDNQKSGDQKSLHNNDNLLDDSHKGKHSIKLQNYLSKQPKHGNCVNKDNVYQKKNLADVLVSDTLMEDDSKNNSFVVSVHCLNATKSSKVDSAVQTISDIAVQTDLPILHSNFISGENKDACLQTEVSGNNGNICNVAPKSINQLKNQSDMVRLESCKNHVSKLEDTLNAMSSKNQIPKANLEALSQVKCKVNKDKKFSSGQINLMDKAPQDNDDDFDIDLGDENLERKDTSVSSALQRGHFQAASILELIDGLQPPSASTSIDHDSFKKLSPNRKVSRRTPLSPIKQVSHKKMLSPSNRLTKAKVKNERSSKLQKVYSSMKVKSNQGILKSKSVEDQEEQKMLADVFFVR